MKNTAPKEKEKDTAPKEKEKDTAALEAEFEQHYVATWEGISRLRAMIVREGNSRAIRWRTGWEPLPVLLPVLEQLLEDLVNVGWVIRGYSRGHTHMLREALKWQKQIGRKR
jgi:hypothetical protein